MEKSKVNGRVVDAKEDEATVEHMQAGWKVTADFGVTDGTPWITRLVIESPFGARRVPVGGITTEFLKNLRTGPLYELLGTDEASPFALALRGAAPAENPVTLHRRPGRSGRADVWYAQWAARYLARVAAGSRRPHHDLAGQPPDYYTPESVRDFMVEARRRGLLDKTRPGKPGGVLTTKAKRLLAKEGQL